MSSFSSKQMILPVVLVGCAAAYACASSPGPAKTPPPPTPVAPPPAPVAVQQVPESSPNPSLFLAQAQFIKGEDGKQKPGPALLTIWQKTAGGWKSYKVEDSDSNVFHKALPYQSGLLTIAAQGAFLKEWKVKDGKWSVESLWNPKWDGKFNRLRDMEIGDVNGDGKDDIVIATHDTGVIGVGSWVGDKLQFTELDKKADTFVHEVEIGDIDGDGKNEFFVTPSARNQSSGKSQPGEVRMYKWDGTAYKPTVVESFENSHAKEILAYDIDGDKKSEFYAVVEAETELGPDGKATVVHPVEIRQYFLKKDGTFEHKVVATIDDKQCRFLVPGDFDGDGKVDLMAAAMKTGIWFLTQDGKGGWTSNNIEDKSSGFEHTAYAADLDKDGHLELYVAADEQRELRSYVWNPATKHFDRTLIGAIPDGVITWNITAAEF